MKMLFVVFVMILNSAIARAIPEAMPEGDNTEAARGWGQWYRMVFNPTSDPAACTVGNYTYVAVRGPDNTIYYRSRSQATGAWSTRWKQLTSMKTYGAPAITCTYYSASNFRVDVFIANAANGNLYHFPNISGTWYPAVNLGGVVDYGSGPAAASNVVGNHLEVIVRGTDHTLFRKYRYYGTWSNWERISTNVKSDPAVALWSQGHMDVFAVDPSFQLWNRFWEGNIWYQPVIQPGTITSSPDVVSRSQGSLDVFARGPNNEMLWKNQSLGVWSGWTSLGGTFLSGPGATDYANHTRMFVFAKGTDGYLWYKSWSP